MSCQSQYAQQNSYEAAEDTWTLAQHCNAACSSAQFVGSLVFQQDAV